MRRKNELFDLQKEAEKLISPNSKKLEKALYEAMGTYGPRKQNGAEMTAPAQPGITLEEAIAGQQRLVDRAISEKWPLALIAHEQFIPASLIRLREIEGLEAELRVREVANSGRGSTMTACLHKAYDEIDRLTVTLSAAEQRAGGMQARIDELMLEYCPDEMTPEQIEEWGRHQKPVSEETAARINAAITSGAGGAMTDSAEKLLPLPCPFCGAKAHHDEEMYEYTCNDRQCPGWHVTAKLHEWSRRAHLSANPVTGQGDITHWVFAAAERHREWVEKMADCAGNRSRSHLLYMLDEMAKRQMSDTKACRWLGWIQCAINEQGLLSLTDLKQINLECSLPAAPMTTASGMDEGGIA